MKYPVRAMFGYVRVRIVIFAALQTCLATATSGSVAEVQPEKPISRVKRGADLPSDMPA